MTQHIAKEQALFVVALDDADAEKQTAFSHADGCPECLVLLRESQAMLRMIDQEPGLAEVDPALEARIRAAVLADTHERARLFGRLEHWAWLLGGLVSGLMIWLDAKPDRSLYPEVGLRCLRYELGFALAALVVGGLWARTTRVPVSPLRASVVAMTGALVGQTLLRVRCEAHDAALHLLAFHLLGVVLATLLGGAAGRLFAKSA